MSTEHRIVGNHETREAGDETRPRAPRRLHVECSCGWHGEVQVWAEHLRSEMSHAD